MKRILFRSVLPLCLLLPLLAMIGGCDRAEKSSAPDAPGQATAVSSFSLAESPMNWSDAVAYCQQQGRRLPRINNNDSWAWADRDAITHIDGFGTRGAPWPSGLPKADYWIETECADREDRAWVARHLSGSVNVLIDYQSTLHPVVCIP